MVFNHSLVYLAVWILRIDGCSPSNILCRRVLSNWWRFWMGFTSNFHSSNAAAIQTLDQFYEYRYRQWTLVHVLQNRVCPEYRSSLLKRTIRTRWSNYWRARARPGWTDKFNIFASVSYEVIESNETLNRFAAFQFRTATPTRLNSKSGKFIALYDE